MVRLGFWIVLGALACMAVTFLPAVLGGGASDLEFVADALFCDGDQAVLTVNLSEAALAKGNLGSVLSGVCRDSAGNRLGSIPPERFADRLAVLIVAGLVGVMLIGIGVFRRAGRSAVTTVPLQSPSPSSVTAARVRQRDAEDVAAANQANYSRARASANAPKPVQYASPATPDWMLGMPSAELQPASPSQRFDFGDSAPSPNSDLQIQLNLLQLAYESSLIPRSEYDAKREALLRSSSAASPGKG